MAIPSTCSLQALVVWFTKTSSVHKYKCKCFLQGNWVKWGMKVGRTIVNHIEGGCGGIQFLRYFSEQNKVGK